MKSNDTYFVCIAPEQSVVVKTKLEQNANSARKGANTQNQKKLASRVTDTANHALPMIGARNKGRLDKNWSPFCLFYGLFYKPRHLKMIYNLVTITSNDYFIASQSFLGAG